MKPEYRLTHSKPIMDQLFEWPEEALQVKSLLPKGPLTTALSYLLQRKQELQVFLEDPNVPMATNHLERALRPIPMGRKNWLFAGQPDRMVDTETVKKVLCG